MRRVREDLWETETESPFPGLTTHAYVWTGSEAGNILFYSTTHAHELDAIEQGLGGIARQYLSHQDEAGPVLATIKDRFGSTLHAPGPEVGRIGKHADIDATFDERVVEPSGVEVIPTPGHSPGSTSFVVRSATGSTYLFTGDLIFMSAEGRWTAGYIPGISDRDAMISSIASLRDVEPDLVISSAFAGDAGVHELGDASWSSCVDEALATLDPSPRAAVTR